MMNVNPKQMNFFDENAGCWDQRVRHDRSKVQRIVGLVDLREGEKVMDVGTGTGVLIPHLEPLIGVNGRIVALDYSENMLKVAREKFPRHRHPTLEFLRADVLKDRLPEGVDAVICYSVFPHFIDQPLALRRLAGCLRTGGRLMVAHSSSREDINGVHVEAGREVANDFLPTMPELQEMMSQAGLESEFEQDDSEFFVAVGRRGTE